MVLFNLYTVVISIYKIGFQISRNAETSIVDDHKATMKARKARGTPWSERRKSRVDRFLAWQPKPETGFEKLDWINSNLQICWYRPFKICCRTGSMLCRIALWDCFRGCFENSFPTQPRNKQWKNQPRSLEQCHSAIHLENWSTLMRARKLKSS